MKDKSRKRQNAKRFNPLKHHVKNRPPKLDSLDVVLINKGAEGIGSLLQAMGARRLGRIFKK